MLSILVGLMMFVVTTISCPLCHECWPEETFTQPAVGLEFGPSQGRIVFKWPNNTIQSIAIVPANPEYLAAMIEIAAEKEEAQAFRSQEQFTSQNESVNTKGSLNTPDIEIYSVTFRPLIAMAQKLKAHVEFALFNHPISMLGVTYPVFFKPHHEALLQEIVRREVGINPSLSYVQTNTATSSASANRVGICRCPLFARECSEETSTFPSHQTVLAIDYSSLFLTTFIYEARSPEIWYSDDNPAVHHTIPIDDHRNTSRRVFWVKVVSSLQKLLATVDSKVDHLVISGSHANNQDLHIAIQNVVGDLAYHGTYYYLGNNDSLLHVGNSSYQQRMGTFVNPSLAAAQGVADLSWRRNIRSCLDPCSQPRTLPSCGKDYVFPRFRRNELWLRFIETSNAID